MQSGAGIWGSLEASVPYGEKKGLEFFAVWNREEIKECINK